MRNGQRRREGFSLAELVVVVSIMAVILSMAVPGTQRWQGDQDAAAMARGLSGAFNIARQEAMRTGDNHIVFLAANSSGDASGNPLVDPSGDRVPLLILNDGPTGTPNQNCQIDAGESTQVISPTSDLNWGFSKAGGNKAPGDLTPISISTGSSFAAPSGDASTWVLFRPDGTPVAFSAGCAQGTVGSGNGAVYVTNGNRDYAVVLSALGSSRVHSWDSNSGAWTQ